MSPTFSFDGIAAAYRVFTEGQTYAAFTENWLRLGQKLSLAVMYQYSGGFFEQHSASLAARWRF